MIRLKAKGSYDKTEKYLKDRSKRDFLKETMEKYGREGVAALSADTPLDTGETATAWNYTIQDDGNSISLVFTNSNTTKTLTVKQQIIL